MRTVIIIAFLSIAFVFSLTISRLGYFEKVSIFEVKQTPVSLICINYQGTVHDISKAFETFSATVTQDTSDYYAVVYQTKPSIFDDHPTEAKVCAKLQAKKQYPKFEHYSFEPKRSLTTLFRGHPAVGQLKIYQEFDTFLKTKNSTFTVSGPFLEIYHHDNGDEITEYWATIQ